MKAILFALFVGLLMVGCGEVMKDPLGHARFVGDLGHKALTFETPKQRNRKAIREAKDGATSLYLYGRQFNDFRPLAELTHLESLQLRHISAPKDFSPLVRLKNLTALRLEDSYLRDLSPLAGLTKLEILNLSSNKITDLTPLAGLSNLKKLYLRGNPIPEDQKEMLKKALPNLFVAWPDFARGSTQQSKPVGNDASSISSSSGQVTHVVQRGETVRGIALRYGVSVDSLKKMNANADFRQLQPGQTLIVGSAASTAPADPAGPTPPFPGKDE